MGMVLVMVVDPVSCFLVLFFLSGGPGGCFCYCRYRRGKRVAQ